MRQKAGANLLAGALATRIGKKKKIIYIKFLKFLGQQQATALTAKQQQPNLTSFTGVGTSKQPSVGEILRMAQENKGGQIKFTPNLINAGRGNIFLLKYSFLIFKAMQAQLLKLQQNQQLQQKSQQILSAATAAANRNAVSVTTIASTSGATIFRAQQQRGPRPVVKIFYR